MKQKLERSQFYHSYYLDGALYLPYTKKLIPKLIKKLKKYDFDSIAFTGMSGALVAPIVAIKMNKPLIMVRKEQDTDNHSHKKVEGFIDAKKYVIIDDCIASGKTRNHIKKMVKKFAPNAKFVATVTYGTLV